MSTDLTGGPAGPREERVFRVFVSSTFRDMHREREVLAKRVFPSLRATCRARSVVFREVDLRWGVPDEVISEGRLLAVLQAEIADSTCFLGLLGQRYGFEVSSLPSPLLGPVPWLPSMAGASLTEVEFRLAVLGPNRAIPHGLFYFRDGAYLDTLPADIRQTHEEVPRQEEVQAMGVAEAGRLAEGRRQRLKSLRESVRRSGEQVRHYRDPSELGEQVEKDLRDLIDRLYPGASPLTSLDREFLAHEAFARRFTEARSHHGRSMRSYVPSADVIARMDRQTESTGSPLVVTGAPGYGKSALLANWVAHSRRTRPGDLVLSHFVDAAPSGADWADLSRRLLGELRREALPGLTIPEGRSALPAALSVAMHKASSQSSIGLVIDGLDRLDLHDRRFDPAWFAKAFPPSVRLVVSCRPGPLLDSLVRHGCTVLELGSFPQDGRADFAKEYLEGYGKQLSPEQLDRIIQAEQSSSPRFLVAVLEELRLQGQHETLDEMISRCLQANSEAEFYEAILARWVVDYDGTCPGLVRAALTALWAAQRGLEETELLELLGEGGEPIAQVYWSPIRFAAGSLVQQRAGLLCISCGEFREAITRTWLGSEREREAIHARLADHFEKQGIWERRVEELPWHLSRAKQWSRLAACLREPAMLAAAWQDNPDRVCVCWREIEHGSAIRRAQVYGPLLEAPHEHPECLLPLAGLFNIVGRLNEVLVATRALERLCRDSGDQRGLTEALLKQAHVYGPRNQRAQAKAVTEEALAIARHLGDHDLVAAAIGNLAGYVDDTDKALALAKESLRLSQEMHDVGSEAIQLTNVAVVLHQMGRRDEALSNIDEAMAISRRHGLIGEEAHAFMILAEIRRSEGDQEGALAEYRRAESLLREEGMTGELTSCLFEQAQILAHDGGPGDAARALAMLTEAEALYQEQRYQAGLPGCLMIRALLHYNAGRTDEALDHLRRAEQLHLELGNPIGAADMLLTQGNIQAEMHDFDAAWRSYEGHQAICEAEGDSYRLANSLVNQATLLLDQGASRAAAMKKLTRAMKLLSPLVPSPDRVVADAAQGMLSQVKDFRRQIGGAWSRWWSALFSSSR